MWQVRWNRIGYICFISLIALSSVGSLKCYQCTDCQDLGQLEAEECVAPTPEPEEITEVTETSPITSTTIMTTITLTTTKPTTTKPTTTKPTTVDMSHETTTPPQQEIKETPSFECYKVTTSDNKVNRNCHIIEDVPKNVTCSDLEAADDSGKCLLCQIDACNISNVATISKYILICMFGFFIF